MRHEIADGLKALALLGVFMVNGLGYALAPNYPMQLGTPTPIDSELAQAVYALVLTLFMGKALPFLAFLFGYSMALYGRRSGSSLVAIQHSLKRRNTKLLLIGVLHGALLYFGDILTAYALMGLLLGGATLQRGRLLMRRWRWWAMLGILFFLPWLHLEWTHYQPNLDYDWSNAAPLLTQMTTFRQFVADNLGAYVAQTLGWLIVLAPLHMALFLAGALAARYRWLSMKPKLPHLFFRPWLYNSWSLALLANALLAAATLQTYRQDGQSANIYWITLVNVPLGIWLVASSLTRMIRHIQIQQTIPKWLVWLAPAGRHTLVMYLGLSLVLTLSGRFGLFTPDAAWNHTAVWFLALLALWLGAVCMARLATEKQMRDPISRWLSR